MWSRRYEWCWRQMTLGGGAEKWLIMVDGSRVEWTKCFQVDESKMRQPVDQSSIAISFLSTNLRHYFAIQYSEAILHSIARRFPRRFPRSVTPLSYRSSIRPSLSRSDTSLTSILFLHFLSSICIQCRGLHRVNHPATDPCCSSCVPVLSHVRSFDLSPFPYQESTPSPNPCTCGPPWWCHVSLGALSLSTPL